MSKDKITKDLKERNDKLANQYRLRDIRCVHLEIENERLQQENKQLKEQLENDIDRYEDTISYQLGFDKGKEYMQQRIDKAIEYIKENTLIDYYGMPCFNNQKNVEELLAILGDKEDE